MSDSGGATGGNNNGQLPLIVPGPDDGRSSFTERPQQLDRRSVTESMAEAANRPLDYDPASRAQFIRRSVQSIQSMIDLEATQPEIFAAHETFANQYPELFKKLIAGEDITQLQSMLHMLDQMATGSLNQHQASMIIGTRLAERYLPHQFRPSQQQAKRGRK
jgi:hypothetical protein